MNAPMDLRLPPHSIEAEQAVLGGLLLGGAPAWDRVADVVSEADFYRDDHRRIFSHMRALAETNKQVDIVTVYASIEAGNEVDQTGGLGYLADIGNATASAANIRRYAEIVVEKARLRALVLFAGEVEALAFGAGKATVQDRIDEATGKLLALAEHGVSKSEPRAIGDVLRKTIEQIEARFMRDGDISGLPTGLSDMDAKLDGLHEGELVIVAGRPSMGKTAFALNIAENVAVDQKKSVLVFSLEMGDTQLATRSLSSLGGINGKSLASGRMEDEEWDRVTVAMGKLHEAPLIIDETPSLSVNQMMARARRQKRKTGLSLVVIDYLQLMRGHGNNRNEELGDITRSLKLMARDLNIPVICLSQLSRKCEERADKRPMLSDLRESGAIEQDADVVLMMYRDDYYNPESEYAGFAEVLIRKNRMGECGDVKLIFQAEYSRFRDADQAAIADAARRAAERREERNAAKSKSRAFRGD